MSAARAGAAALALLLLSAAPAAAQSSRRKPRVYKSSGPVVGVIHIERGDVFDPKVPGEDWWPFRAANKIHWVTREEVVRRELLFKEGELWDPLKALESERNLRSNGSFRRAAVDPAPQAPNGPVDVYVRTQDSWTTNPKLSFGTEGGRHFYSYGLEENNVFGYGKTLGFAHSKNGDDRSDSFVFGDPRFLGTRLRMGGSFSDSSDGDSNGLFLTRPFYALESENAVSASWNRSLGDGQIQRDGEEFSQHRIRSRQVEGSIGQRLNADRAVIHRWELGWYSEKRAYETKPETVPGLLPADQEFSGPTAGWSWVQPRYVKEAYIDRMEIVEDFNLGNEFDLRAGFMPTETGSDRERWLWSAQDQQGVQFGPGRFALGALMASGRAAGGRWENALFSASGNLFWKTEAPGQQTFVAHVEGVTGRYLDRDSQVTLGGDSGLRGYKNASFTGGKAVLFNVEDRFFIPGEFLHLMRFGGVLFFDSGTVIPEGGNFALERFKSDVGLGLRVGSTRSRGGAVGRVDIAYALNGGPGGSRWVLTIQAGQAFSLFNSSARNVRLSPRSRLQ
jgi:hypothetical protein